LGRDDAATKFSFTQKLKVGNAAAAAAKDELTKTILHSSKHTKYIIHANYGKDLEPSLNAQESKIVFLASNANYGKGLELALCYVKVLFLFKMHLFIYHLSSVQSIYLSFIFHLFTYYCVKKNMLFTKKDLKTF
jgi:hypothetical protein